MDIKQTLKATQDKLTALANQAPEETETGSNKTTTSSIHSNQLSQRQRGNLFAGKFPKRHINQADEGLTEEAGEKAKELDEKMKARPDAFLFLHGEHGVGKTQIATFLARRFEKPLYIVAEDYLDELLEIQNGIVPTEEKQKLWRNHQKIKTCDLLVIDELTQIKTTDNSYRKLTKILDHRYYNELPTILLGNCTGDKISNFLTPNIIDRIRETGGAIATNWGSYRTK